MKPINAMYKEEGKGRSFMVFNVIAITGSLALLFISKVLAIVALISSLSLIYMRFVYRYLRDQRGYQDRYTETGQGLISVKQIGRLVFLGLAFIVAYFTVRSLVDSTSAALMITIIPFALMVAIVDYYAGRETREYIEEKEKRHYDFVDSLGQAEGKCMSCQRVIDAEVQLCPHCGYEQKEIKADTNYIARR